MTAFTLLTGVTTQRSVLGLKFGGNRDGVRRNLKVCNRGGRREAATSIRRWIYVIGLSSYITSMDTSDSRCSYMVCNGNAGSVASSPNFAEIVVVRHGETTWNASGRLQGHLDAELNEVGRQQARAVAQRLSKESKIRAIYSSDLKRAVETAEIIAQACDSLVVYHCWICLMPTTPSPSAPFASSVSTTQVIQDSTLRERHLGDLQGLVLHEAARIKPKAYQALKSSKRDQEIPVGGESLDQLHQRCTSSLEGIARRHIGERVVVVTHGGVLRELYRRGASSSKKMFRGKILNASVNIFNVPGAGDEWVIKAWGDVSHLQEIGFLGSAFGGSQASG